MSYFDVRVLPGAPLSRALFGGMEQFHQILTKRSQRFESFGSSLHDFCLRLKDLPSFPFRQYAHDFAHAPTRSAQDLQAVHTGYEQSNAIVTHYADALGIAVEGLEFETSQVDALELFGGIH